MAQVVEGLSETLALLQDAGQNVALLALGRSARAAINLIAATLAKRTPVGEGPTRGALVSALKVEVTVDTAAKGVLALTGFRGPQALVAMSVEYGHDMVGHAPQFRKLGEFIEGRPFMRPTFDTTANAAIQLFDDTMEAELKKVYG
jgi:hypothetical protein